MLSSCSKIRLVYKCNSMLCGSEEKQCSWFYQFPDPPGQFYASGGFAASNKQARPKSRASTEEEGFLYWLLQAVSLCIESSNVVSIWSLSCLNSFAGFFLVSCFLIGPSCALLLISDVFTTWTVWVTLFSCSSLITIKTQVLHELAFCSLFSNL